MGSVAQGINKVTSIKKQVALGTAASGAGGTVLSRRTSVFSAPRDTYESDVIVQHQQSTGVSLGLRKPVGKVDSLLSTETFKLLFAAMLRKDYVAGATTTALTNVTAASTGGATGTYTRAAGSYLTDGFKVGDVIRWTGWTTTGTPNNSRNFFLTGVTALVLTGTHLEGTAVGAKAAGDSVTGVVKGKKTMAPATGQTNDYFTVEEFYNDKTLSETFTDARVNKIDVGVPASGNCTFAADFLALLRTPTGAQVLTTPTEATFREMGAVNGKVYVNGVAQAICTGLQFSVDGNGSLDGPVVGSNSAPDISRGRIKVSGQFTAYFDTTTLQALFEAETVISIAIVVTEDQTATSAFQVFTFGKLKLTNDAPDDGEKGIMRTYPWTAEYNDAGGAALEWDATIMTTQDSQL